MKYLEEIKGEWEIGSNNKLEEFESWALFNHIIVVEWKLFIKYNEEFS